MFQAHDQRMRIGVSTSFWPLVGWKREPMRGWSPDGCLGDAHPSLWRGGSLGGEAYVEPGVAFGAGFASEPAGTGWREVSHVC